ncbi:hypothetical protein DAPPUDRAFT_108355 [Daphnia pulex]|uniref:CxC3 like cysteine cluster domain-containing protein n=1 Tax=Daphnia pulex TaxID=6669 RepID=E9GZX6_DAPPU|nr:hypothetical protein DAPPUDRAFT_108355 [Daphnia pulex]|eukprot:EFX74981.1 hypothetical protein DAPPUDRAFT_108355 [Daphnia pulex]
MPKENKKNGNETDRNKCKLVVQHLRRENRKEKCKRPESFHTLKRVYNKRDPLDPVVTKKSRNVFEGLHVPNLSTDPTSTDTETGDHPGITTFEEPSQVLEKNLKDVEEECHFTKIDKEKDELLHKKKIETKQHAKRMTQISKDWEDNLNIALKAFIENVPVPCFVPLECDGCTLKNSLNLEPASEVSMIVCSTEGRFDLNAASFRCLNINCKNHKEPVLASMRDYVLTGLWPGSPTRSCTLFSKSVLIKWFHLKHKTPSIAAMKYIEVLEKMSTESGRVSIQNGTINPLMFKMANNYFSYVHHKNEVDVKKRERMKCKCCVGPCLYSHFDVVMNLYRYQSAGSGNMDSLYGNEAIKSDEDIQAHIEDETGLGSGCCRHLNILVTGNLKTGESYRFVHHIHHILWGLGYLYLCYDVICNYSTFAKDVAKLSVGHPDHDDFDRMCTEMMGFLSVLHGRTHVWDCQVLHNGRWKNGEAASLGEEQEQVFAKLSRYGSVTKHMSPAYLTTPIYTMVKSNVVNQNTLLRESASDESVDNLKKVEKKLPGSFKADLEGYRMTAAWARKQMNHYGVNLTTSYNLIDTWMLGKRWEEETLEYPEALQETRASIVLLSEEIERVKMILASAANRFQGHSVAYDDENSEEEQNEEDEESVAILPIDNDSEIEYNEQCDE